MSYRLKLFTAVSVVIVSGYFNSALAANSCKILLAGIFYDLNNSPIVKKHTSTKYRSRDYQTFWSSLRVLSKNPDASIDILETDPVPRTGRFSVSFTPGNKSLFFYSREIKDSKILKSIAEDACRQSVGACSYAVADNSGDWASAISIDLAKVPDNKIRMTLLKMYELIAREIETVPKKVMYPLTGELAGQSWGDATQTKNSVRVSGNKGGGFSGNFGRKGSYSAQTDAGLHGDSNGDAILFIKPDSGSSVFVSIDGMGGVGGGYGAYTASDVIAKHIEDQLKRRASLDSALESITQALNEAVRSGNGPESMGAVVVSVEIQNGQAIFRHAGDSRGIIVRDGKVVFQTFDHTYSGDVAKKKQEQLGNNRVGKLQSDSYKQELIEEEARKFRSNVVDRSYQSSEGSPHETNRVTLQEKDRIVLGSDGLWDNMEPSEVAKIVNESKTSDEASERIKQIVDQRMIDEFYLKTAKGKTDNFNVIVIFP